MTTPTRCWCPSSVVTSAAATRLKRCSRGLVAEHGAAYEAYRQQVPMLLPARRPASLAAARQRVLSNAVAAKHGLILVVPTLIVLGLEVIQRL